MAGALLDYLICPRQQRLRDRQAERLGGLEVDHQLEFRRLLDGQFMLFDPKDLSRSAAVEGTTDVQREQDALWSNLNFWTMDPANGHQVADGEVTVRPTQFTTDEDGAAAPRSERNDAAFRALTDATPYESEDGSPAQ